MPDRSKLQRKRGRCADRSKLIAVLLQRGLPTSGHGLHLYLKRGLGASAPSRTKIYGFLNGEPSDKSVIDPVMHQIGVSFCAVEDYSDRQVSKTMKLLQRLQSAVDGPCTLDTWFGEESKIREFSEQAPVLMNDVVAASRIMCEMDPLDRLNVARVASCLAGFFWQSCQSSQCPDISSMINIAVRALPDIRAAIDDPQVARLWGEMLFNTPDQVQHLWGQPDEILTPQQRQAIENRYTTSEHFLKIAIESNDPRVDREQTILVLKAIRMGMARCAIQARDLERARRLIAESGSLARPTVHPLCLGSELALESMFALARDTPSGKSVAIRYFHDALRTFDQHFQGKLHHLSAACCLRLSALDRHNILRKQWLDFSRETFSRSVINNSWIAAIPRELRPVQKKRRSA